MNNQHQSSAQLKASARGVLLGKYGTSIAVMLLCQLILGSVSLFASSMLQSSSLFNTIANYAISLIIELLNGVFFLGQIYFYLNIACSRPYRISNAFYGFHTHTDKAIIVKFLLLIIQILCLAPAILVYLFYKSRPSSFLIMLMTIAAVIGMIALTVFSLLFSQVFYLILDFPDKKISELIDNYKGTDFKHYVEMTIQSLIKKRMNSWVSTYYISIDKLLEKLEREISIGLANYFKTKLVMQSNTVNKIEFTRENNMIAIEAEDISNVTTKAGLISAGIAGLTMMIGGPILMPFISMAAYPVIQKKMLENKLNDAKINVKPEINEALNACVSNLEHELSGNISKRIENIKQMTEYTYDQLFASVRNAIQLEIDKRKNQRDDIGGQVLYLEEKLKTLNELKEQLL